MKKINQDTWFRSIGQPLQRHQSVPVSSSASELVTKFNKWENDARHVGEMHMDRLRKALGEPGVVSDDKTLDVELHDIDSWLASCMPPLHRERERDGPEPG